MKNVIVLFFLISFVLGCATKDKVIDLSNVKIFKIEPVKDKFFQWDDFIDTLKIIKLETIEKSLIGQLWNGFIDESDIYIFDFKFRNFFQFDTIGKFIRTIGTRGRGPGEFLEIRDVCVSDSNVYILDYQRIHSYSRRNGVYIESWALPNLNDKEFNPMNFFVYDKNSYFLWASNPDAYGTGEGYYRMRQIYRNRIISEYFKYEYPSDDEIRFFSCSDNSVYIMPVDGEYIIYKLKNDSIRAFFAIDFGEYAISPQKLNELNNSKEKNAYIRSEFYKHVSKVLETNDYIYFECIGPRSYYHGLIDKRTEEIKFGKWDYAKSPKFFCSDGIFLYGYYEPNVLMERKSNGADLNTCFDPVFDSLKDISLDDNLVIVKVLLKDLL